MNKRVWVLPVLAALLVAGSGVGYAIPSLGGPTGVVSLPNALVAPVGELQTAVSYQKVQAEAIDIYGVSGLDDDFSAWALQALAGVADGAELWAAYSKDNSELDDSIWGIGGKYQFVTEAEAGAAVAIGLSYEKMSGDADGLYLPIDTPLGPFELNTIDLEDAITKAYLVATKDLAAMAGTEWAPGSKLLGSIGVLWLNLDSELTATGTDIIVTGEGDESLVRPFVAIQWIGADLTWLGLEYRWEDDDLDADPVFSAVLGHDFGNGLSGEVGTTNSLLGLGMNDQNWFVRLGYTFPMSEGW